MVAAVRYLLDCFWAPKVWLPPNVTWADVVPNDKVRYTDHTHLYYPLPMALGLLLLRYLLELYVYSPIGQSLGIRGTKPKTAPTNDLLERAYRLNKKVKYMEVVHIAKQTDMSERQVERWLRLRKAQDKPSTLTKFCDDSWRCSCYSFSFLYGIWCLWDKPWLWNIDECWINYPHHSIDNDVWWYYMISLSFIWSLAFSQFRDVKRKDFSQMFVHHLAAIALLSFSWVCNLWRVGTLVLLVHDCADIFLEAAKMAKYAKYQKVCECFFGLFTVVWLITRIGIYPVWILYRFVIHVGCRARSTSISTTRIGNLTYPAYYIFNVLLLLLLCLHLFWTNLIIKVAYAALTSGQGQGDIRSSSDESLSDASTNAANHEKRKAT